MLSHKFTANNFNNGKNKRTYQVWGNMKQRCLNPNSTRYADYGGRGITVCERWLSFENFLADMGVAPDGLTLDRVDNEKGYSPDNCVWNTYANQNKNSRRAKLVTIGKRTMCINDWCRLIGLSYCSYKQRIKNGWSQEQALTKPPLPRGSNVNAKRRKK